MRVALVLDKVGFAVPLGPAYLCSTLKQAGHDVELFSLGECSRSDFAPILRFRPDIVGYSVTTGTHRRYLAFNRELKSRLPFLAVMGGPHPTFYPEVLASEGLDAVCRGEGERAFLELADGMAAGGGAVPERVANFSFKTAEGLVENPLRPLLEDLDSLPFPERRLFLERFPSTRIYRRGEFMAHRGCPYGCSYCFNHIYNRLYRGLGKVYRSRSPNGVCEEIEAARRQGDLRYVHFVDDSFTFDVDWLRDFCRVYRERIRLPFSVNMRLDNCSPEVAELLGRAGCHLVYVGVESGSGRVRGEILKRNMGRSTMIEGVRLLRRQGMRILTENMLGLPSETWREALKTLALNRVLAPDFANASMFYPYPGLDLTRHAIERGLFAGDFDGLEPDYYHGSPLRFENPSDPERMGNLRCFFSLLVRHKSAFRLFRLLAARRSGRLFRMAGDLLDGFYLWRLVPHRLGAANVLRLIRVYLTAYRR